MHYCIMALIPPHVGTDEEPIKEWLETNMEPFNEELEVEPYRVHVEIEEVAKICKFSNIDLGDPNTNPETDEGILKAIRDYFAYDDSSVGVGFDNNVNKHYYMSTTNPHGHWDWWVVGGRWDGWLTENRRPGKQDCANFSLGHEIVKNNSMMARDILHDVIPAAMLVDDKWMARETWDGVKWNTDDNWDQKVVAQLSAHPDHLVVSLDIHN